MGEPELPQVFLASLGWCAEPRVPESLELVPAAARLAESEFFESRIEPIVREITIQEGCVVVCLRRISPIFSHELHQIRRYVGMQIDFPTRCVRLELPFYAWAIFFDLLLDYDGSTAIDKMASLKGESFRDSHSGSSKQHVKVSLLV